MSKPPRNLRLALALLICAPSAHGLNAQTPSAPTQRTTSKPAAKSPREAAARRRKALALLREVAGAARNIEEPTRRAGVLTFCADALWDGDEQSARSLFRRAWETATEADEEDWDEVGRNGGRDLPERYTAARDLVLQYAAARDPRMAEPLLRALDEWLARHNESTGDADDSFTSDGRRLSLAHTLLEDGAYTSAAAVAAPALSGSVGGDFVLFLMRLREHAPAEADALYLRALTAARSDPNAGANEALLLSSYTLTPRMLASLDASGSLQLRPVAGGAGGVAPDISPRVRAAFFDAAAAILLRPGGNAAASYFAVGRLLPFFERDAPRYAPALHARVAALAQELEDARRASLDSRLGTLSPASGSTQDPLGQYVEATARASDERSRDASRLTAVQEAAKRRLWERARTFAGEIVDEETRRAARSVIAARQVAALPEAYADNQGDDFEKAAAFVRAAELTPALRALGLAEASELAARRGKRERGAALLEEAFGHAREAAGDVTMRAAAALVTATTAVRLDSPRAWDALAETVDAVNEDVELDNVPSFDSPSRVGLAPGEREAFGDAFAAYTLDGLFEEAARKDFERAAAEARRLKSELLRADALVACAGVVLAKPPGAKAR